MSKTLCMMCGIPGSGKSFWCKEAINNAANKDMYVYISRDEVRFEFLKDNDDYFAKENEVFKEFISRIDNALKSEGDDKIIYVDATHLNPASRKKVLNALSVKPDYIYAINMMTPLDVCLERNSHREGRALVPSDVIRNMHNKFQAAKLSEGFYTVASVLEDKTIINMYDYYGEETSVEVERVKED